MSENNWDFKQIYNGTHLGWTFMKFGQHLSVPYPLNDYLLFTKMIRIFLEFVSFQAKKDDIALLNKIPSVNFCLNYKVFMLSHKKKV